MNKYERKFNSNDYLPKRFGLKYNPPQIVMEYLTPSTGKLYHHKIKLYKLKSDSNLQEVMKEVYEKHYHYLDAKKIQPNQIVSKKIYNLFLELVEKLKSNLKRCESLTDSKTKEIISQEKDLKSSIEIDELEEDDDYYKFFDYDKEDLNRLSAEDLKTRKDAMEKLYQKNAVLPGDDGFQFDVRVCYIFYF